MKNVYFIRHGEGYHNLYNYNYHNWHLEYPRLTTKGIKQCLAVKKNIDKVDIILVSPLRRTLETAEFIFDKSNKFLAIDYVREFISNQCDYKESNKEISQNFNYVDFSMSYDNYDYNKKETEDDINKRINLFYKYLQDIEFKNIAVVTHGAFLERFIKKYGDNLNIENKGWFDNCEVRKGTLN